ncbi:MAG TPA: ABC transporter ATP-binding protein [Planctomycetaceae bacterium]|nr:ABC transporter ATP-binding protein [Planctomycetaceae bacterium]
MSRPALRIRNLGKQYQIGLRTRGYKTIREAIVNAVRSPWKRLGHLSGRGDEQSFFWALQDVNFDVADGEVLGIIGHNGAGKSTLLKILSQITEPTTGEVEVHGRVGSLLEVGTGFHPELSGRENIYVNGAILGMSRREVKSKFDEIVAFSGVDKFLDTPVKRYSSGMQVRLAFAVAAHLEPEILVVDEVLAVGDQEFQKKCLGKMEEVAGGGRTVLFVSHNMAAVESLCHRACLLDRGRLVATGPVDEIIRRYLDSGCDLNGDIDLTQHPGRPAHHRPILTRMRIFDGSGALSPAVRIGGDIRFELDLHSIEPTRVRLLGIRVIDSRGLKLFTCRTKNCGYDQFVVQGRVTAGCTIKNLRLVPGRYNLHIMVVSGHQTIDEIGAGLEFEVLPLATEASVNVPAAKAGVIVPEESWDIDTRPETPSITNHQYVS